MGCLWLCQGHPGKCWTADSLGKSNQPRSQPWCVVLADLKLPKWYQMAHKTHKNLKISSHQLPIAGSSIPQGGLCSFIFPSVELSKSWRSPERWTCGGYRCYTLKNQEHSWCCYQGQHAFLRVTISSLFLMLHWGNMSFLWHTPEAEVQKFLRTQQFISLP